MTAVHMATCGADCIDFSKPALLAGEQKPANGEDAPDRPPSQDGMSGVAFSVLAYCNDNV